ncbi:hypothetical protein SmJEL517_g02255 [Synchytrium microbalum]|uniref:Ubiquitin-like protease family profile domain-containing protein n=1 Tax=Synchytrium microbalum TaxID=1806994 RepID=A0A507CCH5_9FUNG|nr:uncharacterized protein SmJEL517_g02255 [Synchytrium microbalum]TPX35243.1 hypothetical protein SmJEL517_g02255 [Synchytrium microbalum]
MPYLSYGDVQLSRDDVELLKAPNWINDSLIEFYYEYLERELFPTSSGICFLRPALVQLIAHQEDPTQLKHALPTDLQHQRAIFCPLTDVTDNSAGGSHWSLLVFFRDTNTFYYYDSYGNYNVPSAKYKLAKLYAAFTNDTSSAPAFAEVTTPSQINGYDCGCYVLAISDILAKRLHSVFSSRKSVEVTGKPGDLAQWNISKLLPPEEIHQYRERVRQLIEELRN